MNCKDGMILFKATPQRFGSKKSVSIKHAAKYYKNAWPVYKSSVTKSDRRKVSNNEIKGKIGNTIYRLDRHYAYLGEIEAENPFEGRRATDGFRSVKNSRSKR